MVRLVIKPQGNFDHRDHKGLSQTDGFNFKTSISLTTARVVIIIIIFIVAAKSFTIILIFI